MAYDDGQVLPLPYCSEALRRFLSALGMYGLHAGVIEVKISRRSEA